MSGTTYNTLIDVEALSSCLAAPAGGDVCVIDTRFDLMDPDAGQRAYDAGHIRGALYSNLDQDLAADVTMDTGRHPLPDPESVAKTFGVWGIADQTQVVVYDAGSGAFAARLWWMLRWLGHINVSVLDGGLAAWTNSDQPLSNDPCTREPCEFDAIPDPRMIVSTREILGRAERENGWLIDARSRERFDGIDEPIDPVAGHIPGAVCYPFEKNLDENGCFLSADRLKKQFAPLLNRRLPTDLVCMCGSGVTACHNILAMEHAGLDGARLYVGSWSEWIRDPRRPVISS